MDNQTICDLIDQAKHDGITQPVADAVINDGGNVDACISGTSARV
jgi:hypothetical protein